MRKNEVLESINFIYNGLKRKEFNVLQWVERSYKVGEKDYKLIVHTHFGNYTIDTMHSIALYYNTDKEFTMVSIDNKVNNLIRAGFAFKESR